MVRLITPLYVYIYLDSIIGWVDSLMRSLFVFDFTRYTRQSQPPFPGTGWFTWRWPVEVSVRPKAPVFPKLENTFIYQDSLFPRNLLWPSLIIIASNISLWPPVCIWGCYFLDWPVLYAAEIRQKWGATSVPGSAV